MHHSPKTAAVAVAFVLGAGALAACSSGTGSSGSSASGGSGGACGTAKGTLNMAFIYASTTQNPFQEMALGAKAAAAKDGDVKLIEQAPTGIDPPASVTQFQAAAQTAKDGIAYQTVAPEPFGNALNAAAAAGIPLVAVDAPPPPAAAKSVPLFVGNSNTALGSLLGEAYVKTNPRPGQIVLGNDIPSLHLLVQRLDGLQQVLKTTAQGSTIAGPFDAGSELSDNYSKWKAIVAAHPDAVAFIGVGANDGENLPLIKSQLGRAWAAGSADISRKSLENVKSGSLFALSSPEHWMKGYIAMDRLITAKRTCTPLVSGWWDSGNLLVDKSNIDAIIARQESEQSRTSWFQSEIAKQLANPPLKAIKDAD